MKTKQLLAVLLIICGLVLNSCSPELSKENNINNLSESDYIYRSSVSDISGNSEIISAVFENNKLFYGAYLNHYTLTSYTYDVSGELRPYLSMEPDDMDLIYSIPCQHDLNCVYVLGADTGENFQLKLIQYNTETSSVKKCVNLTNYPEKIWQDTDNVYMYYNSNDYIQIEKYTRDLTFCESYTISGLPEIDYVYELVPVGTEKYACFMYNEQKNNYALSFLDKNFNYLCTAEEKWAKNINGTTLHSDSVLIYEENDEKNELYTFYEIDSESGKTTNIYTAEDIKINQIYSSFLKNDFLYCNDEGIFGYSFSTNTSNLLCSLSSSDISDLRVTDNEKLSISSSVNNDYLISYVTDDKTVKTSITYNSYLLDIFVDKNENIWLLYNDYDNEKMYVEKKDINNTLIFTTEICNGFETVNNAVLSDDYFIAQTLNYENNTIRIIQYDINTGEKKSEVNIDEMLGGVNSIAGIRECDELMYLIADDNLYMIDKDNVLNRIPLSENMQNLKFVNGPDNYDFCFSTITGLYGYTGDEIHCILEWEQCDINILCKNLVYIESEEVIWILGSEIPDSEELIYRFEKCKSSDIKNNKTEIKIAGVGLGQSETADYFSEYISKVSNRSDKIKITVNSYDTCDDMALDLNAGNIPDIIYEKNGDNVFEEYLADLSPYIEKSKVLSSDVFFTNLFNKKEIKSIFPEFYAYSVFGKEKELGKTGKWSAQEFTQFIDKYSVENITSENSMHDIMGYFFIMNFNNYIDIQNKTCSFDTKETRKLLEYTKSLYNAASENNDDNCINLEANISGDAFMDFCTLIPDTVSILSEYFPYDKTVFKAIPSDNDSSAIIQPSYTLGITSSSTHKDESWEILTELLSDEFQNKSELIPVNKKIYKEKLENSRGIYLTDDDIEDIIGFISESDNLIFTNTSLSNIIKEELTVFLNENQSSEKTAETIQSKASLYLYERY